MSTFTEAREWAMSQYGNYVTIEPLQWEVGRKGSGLWLSVPTGFVFDVSVPRALRWLFDPHDPRYLKAAALHDYTLSNGWDRVSAAATFSEALKASGVGRLERLVMVLGVIIFKYR